MIKSIYDIFDNDAIDVIYAITHAISRNDRYYYDGMYVNDDTINLIYNPFNDDMDTEYISITVNSENWISVEFYEDEIRKNPMILSIITTYAIG